MDEFADEIIIIISDFIISKNQFNRTDELINNNYDNLKMYLIFKKDKFKLKLKLNKEIYLLIKKYYVYQNDYDFYMGLNRSNLSSFEKDQSSPILIDALFTGCYLPFAKHSLKPSEKYFKKELFEDIKKMLKLIPSCIHSTWGQLRCRDRVTPLYAAIINKNIPLYIIEYLLKNGANKNMYIRLDWKDTHILDDYYSCECLDGDGNIKENDRFIKLKSLFAGR